MKKLLLLAPLAVILTGCGSDSPEEIAHNYCMAIKTKKFDVAAEYASSDAVRNREKMFENNIGKYSQLFASQNCEVTKLESENEMSHTAYFGGSKLDHVALQYDDKKEQFKVIYDGFKHDMKLY